MRWLLWALLCSSAGVARAGLTADTKARPGSLPLDGAVIVAAPDADPLEAFVA